MTFLRKVVPGGADQSYGIHVARLAGLPQAVIARAQQILEVLEQHNLSVEADGATGQPPKTHPTMPKPRRRVSKKTLQSDSAADSTLYTEDASARRRDSTVGAHAGDTLGCGEYPL